MTTPAVTVLGLGPMGQALAGAFLAAGHPTTVWNRTASRGDDLVARGAVRADDVPEAVATAEVVVVCVRDDAAVEQVLATLRGGVVVNLTSSSPREARERAAWATGRGIDYLAGAIATPTPTIGTDTAVVVYSGPAELFSRCAPTLRALGGRADHLGEDPGAAAALDVAYLAMFWLATTGLVQGLALARAEGVDGEQLASYAEGVAAMLPEMSRRFAAELDRGDFPGTRSTIDSGAASLTHLADTATERGLDPSVLRAVREVITRAADEGHGNDGLARLAELLSRPAT